MWGMAMGSCVWSGAVESSDDCKRRTKKRGGLKKQIEVGWVGLHGMLWVLGNECASGKIDKDSIVGTRDGVLGISLMLSTF